MLLGNLLIWWLLFTGIGTLAARKIIARHGLVLVAVLHAVAVFIGYNLALPSHANIRVDLFLTVPLVLVIIGWGLVHAGRHRSQAEGSDEPSRSRRRQ